MLKLTDTFDGSVKQIEQILETVKNDDHQYRREAEYFALASRDCQRKAATDVTADSKQLLTLVAEINQRAVGVLEERRRETLEIGAKLRQLRDRTIAKQGAKR